MSHEISIAARRWRLLLGRYAKQHLPDLAGQDARLEQTLDALYQREYRQRGVRGDPAERREGQGGGLEASQLDIPQWINAVRELFPQSACETLERHALQRYGLAELLNDPAVLAKLEPNEQLLKSLLLLRGHIHESALHTVRQVVRRVVDALLERLKPVVHQAFSGPRHPQRSWLASSRNFDAKATIRANLRHYDADRRQLLIREPRFSSRRKRHLPWTVMLCIDQSGSMANSVIHSAVLAGVLAQLPSVALRLFLFDTTVVDATGRVDDPVELLLSVQLGGGTDIAQVLRYAESQLTQPRRTVLVLISDFEEGGSVQQMLATVRRLHEGGVTLLGLAALDQEANACFDRKMAASLAERGMSIAALTPEHFAQWLADQLAAP